MNELVGQREGDELQSRGSYGTVINGVLPETSATWLSIIRWPEKLQWGNDGLSCEACVAVGRSAPFEFFITVLCHYMIKMIVGQVSTHSPPVINQWFSVMIKECGDGFLESVSVCCTTASYLIYAERGSYSREANIFNKIETYQSSEQKSHLKYETQIWRNAVLSSSRDKLWAAGVKEDILCFL